MKITKRLFFTVEQKPAMMWISPDFSIFGPLLNHCAPGLGSADKCKRWFGKTNGKRFREIVKKTEIAISQSVAPSDSSAALKPAIESLRDAKMEKFPFLL